MILETNPSFTSARLGVRRLAGYRGVNRPTLPVANRGVGQPVSWLRKSGLAGLASLAALGADTFPEQLSGPGMFDGTPSPAPATGGFWDNLPQIGTAVNAEIGWLNNLIRASTGKAPLPASVSAPTVNVGISDDIRKLVIYGGVGLGAILLVRMLKKR